MVSSQNVIADHKLESQFALGLDFSAKAKESACRAAHDESSIAGACIGALHGYTSPAEIWEEIRVHFEEWDARLRTTCGNYYGVPGARQREVNGYVRRFSLCGLDVADFACDLDQIIRTRKGIQQDDSEYIFLLLQLKGNSRIDHRGRHETLDPGEFYLLDSTCEASIGYGCRDAQFISVHMPRGSFLLEADDRLEVGRKLGAAHPMHAAMQAFFSAGRTALASQRTRGDPRFLYDLTRMAFTPGNGSIDATRASSRENRFALAVSFMERNLHRADMSLGWLAQRIGISERQLQRDFLDQGTSFVRLLRQKRLALAAELLRRNRRGAALPITDIAFGAGFNDISNFNRAFKGRYGCAPSEYLHSHPN